MDRQCIINLCYLLLLFCTAQATHEAGIFHFEVKIGSWTACIRQTTNCSRSRPAACVRASDNQTAPWYYCTERGHQRPLTLEECDVCPQNCAVTQWSLWSTCNCTLSSFRIRTRDVITPARGGGSDCPAVFQQEPCPCAFWGPYDNQPRAHSWKTGEWGSCQALNSSSQCGAGLRNRTVECVDLQGETTGSDSCLAERAYSSIAPPATQTHCELPCPCVLGDWGKFSTCASDCEHREPHGVRVRHRSVLQVPTHGLTCPSAVESVPCTLNNHSCPVYSWSSSTWSQCNFQPDATCGAGYRTRYVYCLETWNGTSRIVDHLRCGKLASNSQPVEISACSLRCPEACIVGDWSSWTECVPSCTPTYSSRSREVLQHPFQEVCPHTLEVRPCPLLPCARWAADEYGVCYFSHGTCGSGLQQRDVHCVSPNNTAMDSRECSDLPRPIISTECRKACPEECVLSPWSEWSPCSETCDGITGNQSRWRQFLANGTTCPLSDASLQETRDCSHSRPCHQPVFSIRHLPWGECVPDSHTSRGSGPLPDNIIDDTINGDGVCTESGVWSRSNECLRDGRVVPDSDCPIAFRGNETERCQVPCSKECVFSEWSLCSASCEQGTRRRVRYLIQQSSSASSSCPVDDDGLDYNYDECQASCSTFGVGVAWYTTNWTKCYLYAEVHSQERCGLGYQTRDVQCVDIGTGHFIAESECTSLEMPRPPAVRDCHVQCGSKCLVTEWPEVTPCAHDGVQTSRRTILPHLGCSDWRSCCPHLTSIPLEQNISCSDPARALTYDYEFVGRDFSSSCIFDDPSMECGVGGKNYREVMCVKSFGDAVNKLFCQENRVTLDLEQDCSVKCDVDCIQSSWSDWSECSSSCGYGVHNRTRSVMTGPQEVGRKCGPSLENDICFIKPCPLVELLPGSFSACVADNSSTCGEGRRTREALCVVDGVIHEAEVCQDVGVASFLFSLWEACFAPCSEDCVTSEWNVWGSCNTNCPVGSCQRQRTRTLLRAGRSQESDSCSEQEFEICYAPEIEYRWEVGVWQDCIVPYNSSAPVTPGQYCGEGRQGRILTCWNGTREKVHDRFCEEAGLVKPPVYRNCSVSCPIDCKLGLFSDWSECSGCYRSMQRRERPVLVHPNEVGQQCRERVQERQCAPVGCVNHTLITHPSLEAPDYSAAGQCGAVVTRLPRSCTVNTRYVAPQECGDFNLTESYTTLECPKAAPCVYSQWSDWSSCLTLCGNPLQPFRFRYKRLMTNSSVLVSGSCDMIILDTQNCDAPMLENWNGTKMMMNMSLGTGMGCLDFQWLASELNGDQREVYCRSQDGVRVNEAACAASPKPSTRIETCDNVTCSEFATCEALDGVCAQTCQTQFEKIEDRCLPISGCVDHTHCLIPNTECVARTCRCRDGFTRAETGDLCVLMATTSGPISTTGQSSLATPTTPEEGTGGMGTSSSSSDEPSTTDIIGINDQGFQLGTLYIVLIGAVPLLLIIVVVFILIIATYRCSRSLEHRHQHGEVQRRRTKASISSPSLSSGRLEMKRRVTDSNSSGFVEGPDAEHYGMAATTFLPDGQAEDCVDNSRFSTPRLSGGTVPIHPIPVAAPVTPCYHGNHPRDIQPLSLAYRHSYRPRYFSDGGVTDFTYTTDDDETVATTSVAPSSPGSPGSSHRSIPTHLNITDPSHFLQVPDSSHFELNHAHQESEADPQNVEHIPDHVRDPAFGDIPENPYVSMHRRSPIYAMVKAGDPTEPVSPCSPGRQSRRHLLNQGERDTRIALGLDNSLVRAAELIEVGGQVTPTSAHSAHAGKRRSGRRRRSHHRPHPKPSWYHDPHYHYFDSGRCMYSENYRSDGNYSSEYDLNSASEAEFMQQHMGPGRNGGARTLPPHLKHSTYHDDNHRYRRHYEYHGSGDKKGRSMDSYYSSREGVVYQGVRPSSSSSRPPEISPQHSLSSPVHYRHQSHASHDYPHHPGRYSSSESNHHSHHRSSDSYHHTHHGRGRYYSEQDYRSSDRSRGSPERSYQSPSGHYSEERECSSPERSSSRHLPPCRHLSEGGHRSTSYHSRSHASSLRQNPSPIVNPPPEFAPPVPPHRNLATPTRDSYDTYDYPMNYQSQAVRQLQDYETNKTSAYARPRPSHLQSTSPQEERITSPYDYPRIKSAGLTTPPTSSAVATPSDSSVQGPVSGSSTESSDAKTYNLTSEALESAVSNSSDLSPLADVPIASSEPAAQAHPQVRGQPEVCSAPPIPASAQPVSSTSVTTNPQNLSLPASTPNHSRSPQSSPLLSSIRPHPPSPLVFHSASVSEESPRTSEVN